MRRSRIAVLAAAVAAATAVTTAVSTLPAQAGGAPLSATLTGADEVPGPGDPDGSGAAEVTINPGTEQVCWTVGYTGLGEVRAAHIHRGTADVAGPVVVPLSPVEAGCATADRDLLLEIVRNPAAFYVNVHTTEFPAGAIRGQLTR